ncbi:hypothetical protein SNK05_013205 [Fusarium graminearum]|nr:unnamed protein product [Fusarium graminearum]
MAFIAIAPEYGVALALAQYLAAKKDLTEANERLQNENRPKFTLAHAFYIQMGGVIVCDLAPRTPREEDEFTNTPWEYISRVEILTSLGQLCDSNLVPRFTEEDIRDLARAAEGHAISQLELSTLAFIPCALAMYILWWQKPFGVERRRVLFRLPNAIDRLPDGFFFSLYDLLKADPEKRMLDAKRKDTGSARVIDLLWFESPEEIDRDKPLPRSASTTISTDSEEEGDTSANALTKKLMKTLFQKSLHDNPSRCLELELSVPSCTRVMEVVRADGLVNFIGTDSSEWNRQASSPPIFIDWQRTDSDVYWNFYDGTSFLSYDFAACYSRANPLFSFIYA